LEPAHHSYVSFEREIARIATEGGYAWRQLAVKKGDFLVWSSNLLHGGDPHDDKLLTRKSQVSHNYFENPVRYTPMFSSKERQHYMVRNIVDLRTNEMRPICSMARSSSQRPSMAFAAESSRRAKDTIGNLQLRTCSAIPTGGKITPTRRTPKITSSATAHEGAAAISPRSALRAGLRYRALAPSGDISTGLAVELGYEAVFGRGTVTTEVATFTARRLSDRAAV